VVVAWPVVVDVAAVAEWVEACNALPLFYGRATRDVVAPSNKKGAHHAPFVLAKN